MPTHLFGFSFSLHPDGSPGLYNKNMAAHILSLNLEDTSLFLQWEIADAIRNEDLAAYEALKDHLYVVSPPLLENINLEFFNVGFIGTNTARQNLRRCMDATAGRNATERLNNLLQDEHLFKQFPNIELRDLVRPKLGPLFTEYRALPNAQLYLQGLGLYQKVRVNRLILDRVIDDDSLLPSLPYISTKDVIDASLNILLNSNGQGWSFDHNHKLSIVAHPLHAGRCQKQLAEELKLKGLVNPIEVEPLDLTQWDEYSAQVWCRTEQNWQKYEQAVAEMLKRK